MPTVITHAIVGSSLSLFRPKEIPIARLAFVLAILSILPDFDVVAFNFGIAYGHPLGHRGFTHSILFSLIAAVFAVALIFRSIPLFTKTWWILLTLCFVSTLSHGILDAFTDAGLGVGFFIPFDNSRYFFPWRPIATSPLSISAFFNGPALRILGNELIWIAGPLVGLVFVRSIIKRLLKK